MPAVSCLDDGDTGLVGYSHQLQIRDGGYLLGCDSHGTGLRRIEDIVEPPEKGRILLNDLVGVDAGEFFFQIIAVQPVEVIESGESPPAQMQCTVDVFLSPGHNGAEFIPVGDILEFHIVQRRAGDDHAVVFPVFYLIEGSVEGFQMIGIGMLRHIAGGLQELHIDLQRCVGQFAQKLGLCHDLGRHQIQDQHIQRPDILVHGTVFRHDENIFLLQCGGCR